MTRLLFANHASAIAGAELVLLDVAAGWPGASAFLFDDGPLAPALAARGLAVTVSRRGGGRLATVRRDGSLLRAAPHLVRFAGVALDLARAARRHDVVYANSQKAFVLAALAAPFVRRPLIWHLHDIIDADHFGTAQRRLQVALANRQAARVVVPSQAAADAFVAAGGRAGLVAVVPNGLDVVPDPRSRAELRQALGLPEGPLVGVFSRLAPWKGQHVLLEALATMPGVGALVVGDSLFGEDAYGDRLRALAAAPAIAGRVHFLGPRADVPLLMQAVDAVVHPSVLPEPFGRTLVEAMCAGTPVVAADAGACPDILDHGRAGGLVPPGDAAALAAALARLLVDPARAAPLVAAARTRAHDLYGVATMRARIAAIVADVAGGAA